MTDPKQLFFPKSVGVSRDEIADALSCYAADGVAADDNRLRDEICQEFVEFDSECPGDDWIEFCEGLLTKAGIPVATD